MKIMRTQTAQILLIALVLIELGLVGYLGIWRETFWQSVETRNMHVFLVYLGYFTVVALTLCFVTGYSAFLVRYISLGYRKGLTRKALKSDYHLIEGGAQRVQEDCFNYYFLRLSIGIGMLKAVVLVIVFSTIIYYQVGALYLLVPLVYVGLGTLIARGIATPLVRLNYLNQCMEAAFRQLLGKVHYAKAHRSTMELAVATKRLTYFQSFFNQITVVLPYLLLAPIYFTMKITFGVLMQAASALSEVVNNLSFLINAYGDINQYLSCKKRLTELGVL